MKIPRSFLVSLFIAGIVLVTCITCQQAESPPEGRKLAEIYCQACHQVPDPSVLPRYGWEEILPTMAAKMGIYVSAQAISHQQLLRANKLLPERPMLTAEEWIKIKNYYLEFSPDSLPQERTKISARPLDWFRPVPLLVGEDIPAASLAKFDDSGVYYGDAITNILYHYSLDDHLAVSYQLDGAPSGILSNDDGTDILTMGNIHPNDQQQGKLFHLTPGDSLSVLIDSLARPVHMTKADLNNDGHTDFVICGFGYLKGDLSWYEHTGKGSYRKHLLRPLPGAVKSTVLDLNGDGHLDILALMAQGDEGFFLYEGDGNGRFSERRLLSFDPSYGSSYYELKDMNGDGLADIIYTNGDNGDYTRPILKPYHGVHVFLQQKGSLTFEEAYFYPMNGPFKAMAEDYNLDGFTDIAVISYFPDYKRTPEESFLVLENKAQTPMAFDARALPSSASGKWLTADRADFDGDGDQDILLGNGPIMSLYIPDSLKTAWDKKPVTLLLLENKRH